jgi:HEAT repeats
MRPWVRLTFFAALTAPMAGCATHPPPPPPLGLIPPAQRAADLRDNRIRLLGVDRAPNLPLNEPIYELPFTAFGVTMNLILFSPIHRLYMYMTGDTPARAVRDIVDPYSADNRRYGILRLAQEAYARQGTSERDLWSNMAANDPDYTVRAAGIRALNWARAPGFTQVFINAMGDSHALVRMEAAKALANIPDPKAIGVLISHLQQDDSYDVRIACADALRCYKTDKAAEALIDVLNDDAFAVAWQARQSLCLMTGYDFGYDEQAWLNYLSQSKQPFG